MRIRRLLLVSLAGVLAIVIVGLAVFIGPYAVRVRQFPADPVAGYHAPYFLYISPGARAGAGRAPATLLVQPNNSGTNSDDPTVHRRDAWWTGFERHRIADDLGVVLLVPAFLRPAEDWRIYTHALDRDVLTTARKDLARLDLQLIAMVEHARATLRAEGVETEPRFLLQGFSASGMFANRFAALHPDRLKAVAAGSPGGWPIAPVASDRGEMLPYPAGVADVQVLTGRPFDGAAFKALPQLLIMGTLDDNDSLDFEDGWDTDAAAQVERLFGSTPVGRWNEAKRLYRGAGSAARFELVEGVGHDRKALQGRSTEFFREVLGSR